MNTFATIAHLLRTDLRRFRLFWLTLLLINIMAAVAERALLPWGPSNAVFSLLRMAQIFLWLILVAQVFLADSVAHSNAGWWTRPIGIGTLLAAKIAYVAVALVLPLLLTYLCAWSYDGYSSRQLVLAGFELFLYTSCSAVLIAGLAAASPGFWRFVGNLSSCLGGVMLIAWIAEVVDWRRDVVDVGAWPVSVAAFVLVLMGALFVAGAICLVGTYGLRRPRMAWLGILVVVSMPLWMPRIAPDDFRGGEHAQVEFAPVLDDGSRARSLVRNLGVRNLPGGHYLLPIGGKFSFSDAADNELEFKVRRQHSNLSDNTDHARLAWSVIRETLPGIRVAHQGSRYGGVEINLAEKGDGGVDLGAPGRLAGNLSYILFEAVHAGTLPIRRGVRLEHEGHELAVIEADSSGGEVDLTIRMTRPRLAFSRKADDRSLRNRRSLSNWVFVWVDPETGQAEFDSDRSYGTAGGPFVVTHRSMRRVSFSKPGLSSGSESEPELHVFRIVARGIHTHEFEFDEHIVDADVQGLTVEKMAGVEPIERQPESVVKKESIKTLDDLAAFDFDRRYEERQQFEKLAIEIFRRDLPAAIGRSPWEPMRHGALMEAIPRDPGEAVLQAIYEALPRDPRLIAAVNPAAVAERLSAYAR